MARRQKYGIRFPITSSSGERMFDMDGDMYESVKSQLVHLIFTPAGQRLRDPEFGTDLVKRIFEGYSEEEMDDIVFEIKSKVGKYVPSCVVDDVEIAQDGDTASVRVKYSVRGDDGEMHKYELTHSV